MGKKRSGGAGREGAGRGQVVTTEGGLHRVTVAPGNAEAQAVAQQHHRVPLKVALYDLDVRLEGAEEAVATTAAERYGTTPALETLRCELYWKLRHSLERHCRAETPPVELCPLAFERWQFNCMLQRHEAGAEAKSNGEPLIPVRMGAEEGLVADLERSGVAAARARRIASAIAIESSEAAVAVRAKAAEERKRCGGSDLMSGLKAAQLHTDSARAVVVQHKHTLDVFAAHRPKRLLKVTNVHYKKLQELWRRHAAGRGKRTWEGKAGKGKGRAAAGKGDGDGEHAGSAEERQRFHNDLLCVLLRYHALQGHGFQAAAGEHVFRALLQHVGASMECFASPLNCHFAPFCSAFPDTDAPFGSLGDFFTFHPSRGSFQANPPFVPKLMEAMVTHLEALLAAPDSGPLSFAVVVPGWTEVPSWAALSSSLFLRRTLLVAKADHGYCDGAQHQRQDRFRDAPYDTAVFFLQNAMGATEWPVCDATEAAVRAAFARGLPTEAERSRIAAKPTGGGRMRIEKRQQARMQQREQERRASGKSGRRKKSRATQVAGVGAGHDGLRPDGGVKKTWRKGKGKNAAASK